MKDLIIGSAAETVLTLGTWRMRHVVERSPSGCDRVEATRCEPGTMPGSGELVATVKDGGDEEYRTVTVRTKAHGGDIPDGADFRPESFARASCEARTATYTTPTIEQADAFRLRDAPAKAELEARRKANQAQVLKSLIEDGLFVTRVLDARPWMQETPEPEEADDVWILRAEEKLAGGRVNGHFVRSPEINMVAKDHIRVIGIRRTRVEWHGYPGATEIRAVVAPI